MPLRRETAELCLHSGATAFIPRKDKYLGAKSRNPLGKLSALTAVHIHSAVPCSLPPGSSFVLKRNGRDFRIQWLIGWGLPASPS